MTVRLRLMVDADGDSDSDGDGSGRLESTDNASEVASSGTHTKPDTTCS